MARRIKDRSICVSPFAQLQLVPFPYALARVKALWQVVRTDAAVSSPADGAVLPICHRVTGKMRPSLYLVWCAWGGL